MKDLIKEGRKIQETFKSSMNENITKLLQGVRAKGVNGVEDAWYTMQKRFFVEQTKSLNNSYKSELEQYTGKKITPDMVGKSIKFRDTYVGKTITTMAFSVREATTLTDVPFEIVLVIKFEPNGRFELPV